jgi:hypothetical protein
MSRIAEGRDQRVLNCFIEDQAFSPPYDLASHPSPSSISKLPLFLSFPVFRCSSLLKEDGAGVTYDGEKAWSSINHSILSGGDQGRGMSSDNEHENDQLSGSACVAAGLEKGGWQGVGVSM